MPVTAYQGVHSSLPLRLRRQRAPSLTGALPSGEGGDEEPRGSWQKSSFCDKTLAQ